MEFRVALRNHVSRLRKDLGADMLVTKPWGYGYHQNWVLLTSGRATGGIDLLVGLNSNANEFGHEAAVVAFDNFDATADSVYCAGVPLPPRRPCP